MRARRRRRQRLLLLLLFLSLPSAPTLSPSRRPAAQPNPPSRRPPAPTSRTRQPAESGNRRGVTWGECVSREWRSRMEVFALHEKKGEQPRTSARSLAVTCAFFSAPARRSLSPRATHALHARPTPKRDTLSLPAARRRG